MPSLLVSNRSLIRFYLLVETLSLHHWPLKLLVWKWVSSLALLNIWQNLWLGGSTTLCGLDWSYTSSTSNYFGFGMWCHALLFLMCRTDLLLGFDDLSSWCDSPTLIWSSSYLYGLLFIRLLLIIFIRPVECFVFLEYVFHLHFLFMACLFGALYDGVMDIAEDIFDVEDVANVLNNIASCPQSWRLFNSKHLAVLRALGNGRTIAISSP